jgi:hypothetical protein
MYSFPAKFGNLQELRLVRQGEAQQCISALQVEPATDMCAVIFNCSNANAKLASDVAGAHSQCNELQYLALRSGEFIQSGPLLN